MWILLFILAEVQHAKIVRKVTYHEKERRNKGLKRSLKAEQSHSLSRKLLGKLRKKKKKNKVTLRKSLKLQYFRIYTL
jgi:hypothetical protein